MAADLGGVLNVLTPTLRRWHERRAGGVVAISSIAAQEERRAGIRVNAVAMGLTDKDRGAETIQRWGEDVSRRVLDAAALGRIGRREDIAKAVAFLAASDAGSITGRILQVEGGRIIAG